MNDIELKAMLLSVRKVKSNLPEEFKLLLRKRKKLAKTIDSEMLGIYTEICKNNDGIGIVEVVRSTCSSCNRELPKVTMSKLKNIDTNKPITCCSCGCLLYLEQGYDNHCHGCGRKVDSRVDARCDKCRWIKCSECGSCGCDYSK
ncbi:MAG TPA: hypothetical protein PLK94_00075 [Alphaproteobacteria bacterium]|nr:hypothetical protein [Alphaproteobacteria bacterium]